MKYKNIHNLVSAAVLVLTFLLQAILTGVVLSDFGGLHQSMAFVLQIVEIGILIVAAVIAYRTVKKELLLKRKTELYEQLVDKQAELHKAWYQFSTSLKNDYWIERSNPKDGNDFAVKRLRDASKRIGESHGKLTSNSQELYEFLEGWKFMLELETWKKIRWWFDLEAIRREQVWMYQRELSNYEFLSLSRTEQGIVAIKQRLMILDSKVSEIDSLCVRITTEMIESITLDLLSGTGLLKNVSMYDFGELENSEDGREMLSLTAQGLQLKQYERSSFQIEHGDSKRREQELRELIKVEKE